MQLTGIRRMEMIETEDPKIVRPDDVLIQMKVVGVCGSDIHYYTHGRIGSQVVTYPFTVGHEGSGVVAAVGDAVTRVKPGDRIAIEPAMPCYRCDQCMAGRHHTCRHLKFLGCPNQADGCLSEFIVMPENCCFPVPDQMSFDQAAISEPLAIGLYATQLAQTDFTEKTAGILGFGPIGMSVLLPLIHQGIGRVFVTDKINSRLALAQKCGAFYTGNPVDEDIVASVIQKEEALLDVVFECCGQQDAMDQAVKLLKPGGKLMIIGIPEFDRWSFPVDSLRHKEIGIQNVRRQNRALASTLRLLADQKIDVSLMPTHRFPFSRTREAFELVSDLRDGVMKAMIDFD